MRAAGMLRLPVISPSGELVGTISIGDIIRHQAADSRKLFEALAAVCVNDGAPERALEEAISS